MPSVPIAPSVLYPLPQPLASLELQLGSGGLFEGLCGQPDPTVQLQCWEHSLWSPAAQGHRRRCAGDVVGGEPLPKEHHADRTGGGLGEGCGPSVGAASCRRSNFSMGKECGSGPARDEGCAWERGGCCSTDSPAASPQPLPLREAETHSFYLSLGLK